VLLWGAVAGSAEAMAYGRSDEGHTGGRQGSTSREGWSAEPRGSEVASRQGERDGEAGQLPMHS